VHSLVALAKRSVEEFVKTGRVIEPPDPLPDELRSKAGIFVCLKKKGELCGCIGTFLPCCENVAAETIRNAISAASQDFRFRPVTVDDLDEIVYTVDVLSTPEKVEDIGRLDPRAYGVIVASGRKRGLLLPDLEGVDTVQEQLRIARMKAGIMPDEPCEIFRFTVERYT
jgi:AmmeMemoRadiSam system protein A